MKRIWFGVLLVYVVTTWYIFEQPLGTRMENLLFSPDVHLFLNNYCFGGGICFYGIVISCFNVGSSGLQQDAM